MALFSFLALANEPEPDQPHEQESAHSHDEGALYDVLAIEQEAQAIIRASEEEAAQIIAEARAQAAERVRSAHETVEQKAHQAIRHALRASQYETDTIAERAEQEALAWAESARERIGSVVAQVTRIVTLVDSEDA